MKSLKPGRGPSMMGAFGSAAAAVFGVIWTLFALSMGAPIFFALFGIIFVLVGVAQAAYNYKNATAKNRFSSFDITDSKEESDPLNEYFTEKQEERVSADATEDKEPHHRSGTNLFCPYCGAEAEHDFFYCAKCGKKLPD